MNNVTHLIFFCNFLCEMLPIYSYLCVVYSRNGDNEHLLEYAEKGYNLSRKLNGDKHDATKWWKQLLKQAKHS